jgi:uncharacterized protein YecT (DUF1311 family)
MNIKSLLFYFTLISSQVVFSQTQIELNLKAKEKYELVNKELNKVLNKLLILHKYNKEKKAEILLNHKTWIKERDSFMNNSYPENQKKDYGTYFPVVWYNELSKLTNNRIRQLKLNYF